MYLTKCSECGNEVKVKDVICSDCNDDSAQEVMELGCVPRPLLRLGYIEKIIRENEIIVPCPSRPTLIQMIEGGVFEAKQSSFGWAIYKDSFLKWVQELQSPEEIAAKKAA